MKKPSENLQVPESKWLTADDFEYICFNLAREFFTFNEPIPDYNTRDKNLLEASLASPKQTFNKEFLYPTLAKQVTVLFYSLIKNHPFRNGNKRIAVMALLAFLSINKKWLDIPPLDLYKIACFVSESKSKEKNKVFSKTEQLIEKFTVDSPNY